jgi:hypothetical protein
MAIRKDRFTARNVKTVRCNCGGPQYGTDHSPDCDLLIAEDAAEELRKEGVYNDRMANIEAANARGELTPKEYQEACYKAALL